MFGNHFYHQRIRKAVASFGAIFNNVYVLRTDAGGQVISTLKVPLSYGPRAKFLARIRENPDLYTDSKVAIKLPRMSFEITSISYDATRQLPKLGNINRAVTGSSTARNKIFNAVPYILSFQLSIFAKNQDDALQIVEQIIPYFNPQYTMSVKPLADFPDIIEDVPITLTGVVMNDEYEGDVATRRTIIYTLDFDMVVSFHGPVGSQSIVRTVNAALGQLTLGLYDSDLTLETVNVTINPGDANPEDDFGFVTTIIPRIDSA